MPVKRRIAKARKQLDNLDIEDLFYGPGTCLLNGFGYLGPYGDGMWHDKPDDVQAAVLDVMRVDWQRHSATVMAAWSARTEHDHYIAREYHGDPDQPWPLTEFGDMQD